MIQNLPEEDQTKEDLNQNRDQDQDPKEIKKTKKLIIKTEQGKTHHHPNHDLI